MTAKVRRYASELGWPIGISLAMLALWEFAVRVLGIRSIILPPPKDARSTGKRQMTSGVPREADCAPRPWRMFVMLK
jgi:ABC-type nitrate/sulfonate/bicarbonate transport system permease component